MDHEDSLGFLCHSLFWLSFAFLGEQSKYYDADNHEYYWDKLEENKNFKTIGSWEYMEVQAIVCK